MTVPWWELIVRSLIVYVFLLVLIRLTGKRQVGQLAPFDLILLLVLSNAVQNAMNGGDNSVQAGLISAVTLVSLNYGIGYLTYRSKRLEAMVEGRPQLLIHNGRLYKDVMEEQRLTQHELDAALRRQGVSDISLVRIAMIENNGDITVQLKEE
ncbi:MAG: YetF domain-containing protein [Vicinamibacteria bacterium]